MDTLFKLNDIKTKLIVAALHEASYWNYRFEYVYRMQHIRRYSLNIMVKDVGDRKNYIIPYTPGKTIIKNMKSNQMVYIPMSFANHPSKWGSIALFVNYDFICVISRQLYDQFYDVAKHTYNMVEPIAPDRSWNNHLPTSQSITVYKFVGIPEDAIQSHYLIREREHLMPFHLANQKSITENISI